MRPPLSLPSLHFVTSPSLLSYPPARHLTNRHGNGGMGGTTGEVKSIGPSSYGLISSSGTFLVDWTGEAGIVFAWWNQLEWPTGEELIVCEGQPCACKTEDEEQIC
ncbi:unnamed protein product [Closterium sp. NIES-53]